MILENNVTAQWIAREPCERASQFLQFEEVAVLQGAVIKGEIDTTYFDISVPLSTDENNQKRQAIFEAASGLEIRLEEIARLRDKREFKKRIMGLRWTRKGIHAMAESLNDFELIDACDVLGSLANSIVHGTPFGAKASMTDDSKFKFGPDPVLAVCAVGYGSAHLIDLSLLLCTHLGFDLKDELIRAREELRQLNVEFGLEMKWSN